MKWFNFIIFGLATLINVPSFSQDPVKSSYFSVRLDMPDPDKGSGHYKRNAKRALKDENVRDASLYAMEWLVSEDKERNMKKAQELLQEALPQALSRTEEEISSQEANFSEAEGKSLLEKIRDVKRLYLTLMEIQNRHASLEEKWKIKGAGFREDYQSRLELTDQQLCSIITQLAEKYYQQAQHLIKEEPANRQENLEVARVLKQCRLYLPGYKDVDSQYAGYKEKATTRLAILPIQNKSNYGQVFTTQMQKALHREFMKKLNTNPLDFFELVPLELSEVPEKRNVAFQLELLGFQIGKKVNEPTETKREKAIKSENSKAERIITGYHISYSKQATVSVEAKYHIIDSETQEILATKAVVSRPILAWSHRWYGCRGNCEALKKRERRQVENQNKDEPFPDNIKLAQIAIEDSTFNNGLADNILPFAKTHGQ